jgi:hypothetical protein
VRPAVLNAWHNNALMTIIMHMAAGLLAQVMAEREREREISSEAAQQGRIVHCMHHYIHAHAALTRGIAVCIVAMAPVWK